MMEEGLSMLSNYLLDHLRELTSRRTLLILTYCLCSLLRSGQQVVEEGLSVLSNYLLAQLRELTSLHTLLILIYCLCSGVGSRWWRRG